MRSNKERFSFVDCKEEVPYETYDPEKQLELALQRTREVADYSDFLRSVYKVSTGRNIALPKKFSPLVARSQKNSSEVERREVERNAGVENKQEQSEKILVPSTPRGRYSSHETSKYYEEFHDYILMDDLNKVNEHIDYIDLEERDREGRTFLHHAVRYQVKDIVIGLLARGAPVNTTDTYGATPLSSAVERLLNSWGEAREIVLLLMKCGADHYKIADFDNKGVFKVGVYEAYITLLEENGYSHLMEKNTSSSSDYVEDQGSILYKELERATEKLAAYEISPEDSEDREEDDSDCSSDEETVIDELSEEDSIVSNGALYINLQATGTE
jgi:hypothetical protein